MGCFDLRIDKVRNGGNCSKVRERLSDQRKRHCLCPLSDNGDKVLKRARE